MSKLFALVQPLLQRTAILALALFLLSPASALALEAEDYDKAEHRANPPGLRKATIEKVEVEDDLLVLPDPEDTFSPDLPVLPDAWSTFPDVKEEVEKAGGPERVWYVADGWLNYVVAEGLMSGYSTGANAGCFGSYDSITRGQVAAILYRAECAKNPSLIEDYGSSTDPSDYAWSCEFKDVMSGTYYTAAINWAKNAGILTGDAGTNRTTVRPNDPVTRQEFCLMLARYANDGEMPEAKLDLDKTEGILGMENIASWARNGVYWAINNDVIDGVNNGDGTFSMEPTGSTWRSAAAKMLTVVMRSAL